MIVRRFAIFAALTMLALGTAHATYLCDWSATGVNHITDAVGDCSDAGFDIIGTYSFESGGTDYFRMDLAAAPHEDIYSYYWIAYPYPDTSVLVGVGYYNHHAFFSRSGGSPYIYNYVPFQDTQNGGTTIEWAIPSGYPELLGGVGSTYLYSYAPTGSTLEDTSQPLSNGSGNTPEPTSLALLGIGLAGIVIKRRRNARA